MKIYRDKDPLMGSIYFFREGLTCSTCAKPITDQWPALFRDFLPGARDNSLPPNWDVVHKVLRDNPATHNCDDRTKGTSKWSELKGLTPALFIGLHDRLLKLLALKGIITPAERERQISLFGELLYEAVERGMEPLPKLTPAQIQKQVSEGDLVPPALTDPV